MTKERIEKELTKVREQLAGLQARQKDLEEQLQMAEDAEKMKFIEKNKISLERLILLNKVSEEEIRHLLKKKEQEEQLAAMAQEMDPFSGEGTDTQFSGDNPPEKSSPAAEPVHAYVDKGQRYDDMSSSASAFFLVGGVLAIGAALCLLEIFHLPMAGFQKYMFEGVLVILAIGSFVVAVSSRKRAAELKVEADDEKRQTQEIIDWFLKNYSAKELDEQLLMEDPNLSGEELSLKRFELIQDFLITGRDIPDQSYADSLCETLYTKLYDQE